MTDLNGSIQEKAQVYAENLRRMKDTFRTLGLPTAALDRHLKSFETLGAEVFTASSPEPSAPPGSPASPPSPPKRPGTKGPPRSAGYSFDVFVNRGHPSGAGIGLSKDLTSAMNLINGVFERSGEFLSARWEGDTIHTVSSADKEMSGAAYAMIKEIIDKREDAQIGEALSEELTPTTIVTRNVSDEKAGRRGQNELSAKMALNAGFFTKNTDGTNTYRYEEGLKVPSAKGGITTLDKSFMATSRNAYKRERERKAEKQRIMDAAILLIGGNIRSFHKLRPKQQEEIYRRAEQALAKQAAAQSPELLKAELDAEFQKQSVTREIKSARILADPSFIPSDTRGYSEAVKAIVRERRAEEAFKAMTPEMLERRVSRRMQMSELSKEAYDRWLKANPESREARKARKAARDKQKRAAKNVAGFVRRAASSVLSGIYKLVGGIAGTSAKAYKELTRIAEDVHKQLTSGAQFNLESYEMQRYKYIGNLIGVGPDGMATLFGQNLARWGDPITGWRDDDFITAAILQREKTGDVTNLFLGKEKNPIARAMADIDSAIQNVLNERNPITHGKVEGMGAAFELTRNFLAGRGRQIEALFLDAWYRDVQSHGMTLDRTGKDGEKIRINTAEKFIDYKYGNASADDLRALESENEAFDSTLRMWEEFTTLLGAIKDALVTRIGSKLDIVVSWLERLSRPLIKQISPTQAEEMGKRAQASNLEYQERLDNALETERMVLGFQNKALGFTGEELTRAHETYSKEGMIEPFVPADKMPEFLMVMRTMSRINYYEDQKRQVEKELEAEPIDQLRVGGANTIANMAVDAASYAAGRDQRFLRQKIREPGPGPLSYSPGAIINRTLSELSASGMEATIAEVDARIASTERYIRNLETILESPTATPRDIREAKQKLDTLKTELIADTVLRDSYEVPERKVELKNYAKQIADNEKGIEQIESLSDAQLERRLGQAILGPYHIRENPQNDVNYLELQEWIRLNKGIAEPTLDDMLLYNAESSISIPLSREQAIHILTAPLQRAIDTWRREEQDSRRDQDVREKTNEILTAYGGDSRFERAKALEQLPYRADDLNLLQQIQEWMTDILNQAARNEIELMRFANGSYIKTSDPAGTSRDGELRIVIQTDKGQRTFRTSQLLENPRTVIDIWNDRFEEQEHRSDRAR
jgi:hypothetical protein